MLENTDPVIASLIEKEERRQHETLQLIPSENYVSSAVMEATGSVLTNKYSEGYPFKRYYQGNEFIDEIEQLAIDRAKELFGAEHVNVQTLSGSPANIAIFHALLSAGDTILGLDLACGGHLTHGCPVNFSGKTYNAITYTLNKETQRLDMEQIRELALEHKPKLIISGITAYSREVDFKAFDKIAREVGAYHLADISHISGLVAAGLHQSPFPLADVVMTTTHKTLRGPRGAIIMCKKEHAKAIDKAVFPGMQGGPHNHVTAAKAVAFLEALQPQYKDYAKHVVDNAKALARSLSEKNISLVSGGTDNHLLLIDLLPMGVGLGKKAAVALERAGIVTNANTVPFDPSTPFKPSGVRIGTPAITTRGMRTEHMPQIASWIADVIEHMDDEERQFAIAAEVKSFCKEFPLFCSK